MKPYSAAGVQQLLGPGALGVQGRAVGPEAGHRQGADGLPVGRGGPGEAVPGAAAEVGAGALADQGAQPFTHRTAGREDDHVRVDGRAAHDERLPRGGGQALLGEPVAVLPAALQDVAAGAVRVEQAGPQPGGDPAGGDGVLHHEHHEQVQDRQPQIRRGLREVPRGGGGPPGGEQQVDHSGGAGDQVGGVPVEGGGAGHGEHRRGTGVGGADREQAQVASRGLQHGGGDPAGGDVRDRVRVRREGRAGRQGAVGVAQGHRRVGGVGRPRDDPADVAPGREQVVEEFLGPRRRTGAGTAVRRPAVVGPHAVRGGGPGVPAGHVVPLPFLTVPASLAVPAVPRVAAAAAVVRSATLPQGCRAGRRPEREAPPAAPGGTEQPAEPRGRPGPGEVPGRSLLCCPGSRDVLLPPVLRRPLRPPRGRPA
ncbi:hypothetical protein GCM10010389_64870 [Streptomyces echinoruber]|uniref:Uncharacterized protein n=1 Tax=Streptomyces echinoruber TaxID=68898 RepID=A0A918S003_9ACTN|nr:hypothetical protein GCM10010389_64870 [Streptomyces echinoruber]